MDEARQLGIVDAVVAREKLEGRAEALAVKIARAGREAVSQTKVLLRAGCRDPRPRGLVRGAVGR